MNHNIKLICFDLDETLLSHSSWKRLNFALGMSEEEDRRLYNAYMAGEISYELWNDRVLEHYLRHKDSTKEGITEILSQYQYNDGARETIDYLLDKGYEIVLISGSMDIMVSIVAHDLGIKYYKANNDLIFDEKNNLQAIHCGGDDVDAKLRYLESFCELLNIKIEECACVGDGYNDLNLFKKTQHGITFTGGTVEKDAWKVINTLPDLKNIF